MTETYTTSSWELVDLFPGHKSDEMQAAFEKLETLTAEFEGKRDTLAPDMSTDDFMGFVHALESMTRQAARVNQFAGLWFSQDTQNQDATTFQSKVQQFMAEIQNRTMFFSLWWKSLEDVDAERLMAAAGDFQYYLQQMRNFKPYTLSEPEEKIINIKDVTGANALQTLYSAITNRYVFKVEVDGEEKSLTRGELMNLVYRPDPDIRARAYQELYHVYAEDGPILGQIYQNLVRDYCNENLNLRGFSSPISVRNLSNDVPDAAIDTLLDVSEKNAALFQRFFKLKAKWLRVDKLRRYDIYAPVASSDKQYDFNDAVYMTLDAFGEFNPQVAELAQTVFAEGHIDSEVRAGKRSGAFCSSSDPALTPFVLLSYNGSARDVSTLAHELGHAIHALLADQHHIFDYHASLPMAETASTFAEMLLVDHMLELETDEAVKRDILFAQVDDAYGTIMRQVFFALFERQAHQMTAEGASVDELCEAYMHNLETQFGDSLEIGAEFKWEWAAIPHIYMYPFYVYAYAFGQLLVFALYQQYREEGASFVPRYMEILAAGGSMPPEDILKRAGLDMRAPAFWQGGYDFIAEMIEKLAAIPVA